MKPKLTVLSYYFNDPLDVGGNRWFEMADVLAEHFDLTVITSTQLSVLPNKYKVFIVPGNANKRMTGSGFRSQRSRLIFSGKCVGLLKNLLMFPDSQIFWANRCLRGARKQGLIASSNSVLITTSPIQSVHVAALRAKSRGVLKARWIMDMRDPWTNDPGNVYPPKWPHCLHKREVLLEKRCIQNADAVVCATPGMAALYRDVTCPVYTILNGYPRADYVARGNATSGLVKRIRYFGKIIPGLRDPSLLFSAVGKLGLTCVRFEFWSDQVEYVGALAAKYGIENAISFMPRINRDEVRAKQREADCNLVLNSTDASGDHILPTKLFEYVAAGRPIIAITGLRSNMASIMHHNKWGEAVFDEDSALSAISKLVQGQISNPADVEFNYSRESSAMQYVELVGGLR